MREFKLTDNWVKGVLAIAWSLFVMLAVGYIIVVHGKEKEILTLLIGFITGVITTIFGVYYASSINTKHPTAGTGTATVDFTATTTTTTEDTEPTK